jgi:hypothetical protein
MPQSAGPGLGRAKSPPEHAIERVFEALSAMLPTASGRIVGARRGHRATVCAGQQRTIRVRDRPGRRPIASSCRRSGARLFRALKATVRACSGRPAQVAVVTTPSHIPKAGRGREHLVSVVSRATQHHGADRRWRGGGPEHGLPLALSGAYPVEADQMSVLPKLAGQSPSGQGAGRARLPCSSDAARYAWTASQTAAVCAVV